MSSVRHATTPTPALLASCLGPTVGLWLGYDYGGLHNNPYYSSRDELPIFTPHFDLIAQVRPHPPRQLVRLPRQPLSRPEG